jgi:chitinase
MKLAVSRSGAILVLASLLQACGGGGGDGGGNIPGGGSSTRLSVSATSVSVSATPGEATPVRTVTLNVTNPPAAGLYVEGAYSASGIDTLDFVGNSASQGTLTIRFRSPGSLPNGTYPDSIQLRVCTEQPCVTQISGSPANITTSYVVSGNGTSSATLDRNSIQIGADSDDQAIRVETVRLTLSAAPALPVYVQTSHTTNAIQGAVYRTVSSMQTDVDISFRGGQSLGSGTFNDTVTLTVCYDSSCVRQVQGSPFTVSTTMTVGAAAEPGVAPLDVLSRVALPHDVIDAEFSKALNRIVMVGSYPANALHVYDVATGTERQVALNRLPTAVSISPDGLTAAVGHDALITVVDLATVGQPGAPAPIILNVSAVVFDVILDGRGYVHALPRVDQWVAIHSVHIATNTEYLSTGRSLRAGSRGRLHPSGDYIYDANNGLSPDDIEKWDIRAGAAVGMYDSPYHGDYGMCGNLWFNEPGSTIYTACGNTFRSSEVQAQDMVYSGRIELSVLNGVSYLIRAVSQSEALGEIALIEYDYYRCEVAVWTGPCYHHLAFYESAFLNRQAVYSLAPVTVNGTTYAQRGLFVFHDAIGTNKYLLSRLHGTPDPDAEYYLSVVP